MKNLLEGFLSTLFPRSCPLCRSVILERGTVFCSACLEGFETIREPFCFRCGSPLPQGQAEPGDALCPVCLARGAGRSAPFTVRSIAHYGGNVRKAVLRLKFGGDRAVGRSLSLFVKDHYGRFFPIDAFQSILPVPLHSRRLREREFNQCVLLARPLAAHLGIPLDLRAVERVRHTSPQSASTEAERRKNLRDAFMVRRPERIYGRSILLFDDVYTTGATLEELARSVLSARPRRVCGLTLARSPRPLAVSS